MISQNSIRANEYRRQDLLAAVARDRRIDEVRRSAPKTSRTASVRHVQALTHRAVAALAVVHAFRVGRTAEA